MPDRGIPRKFEQKLRLVSYGKRQQEPSLLAMSEVKGRETKQRPRCHAKPDQKPDMYVAALNRRRFVMFFEVVIS
jgi:hypothetical protein